MSRKWFLLAVLFCLPAGAALAAIIGTNTPALSLTAKRIATLPAAQQSAWTKYLKHSERQMQADQAVLFKELQKNKIKQPLMPPHERNASDLPLRQPAAWYGQEEARRDADGVISFQTPAGGWSKNLDMTQQQRVPGEHFATDNLSRFLTPSDFDTPRDPSWNYVGTFDNDATITQLHFLAKVIAARGVGQSAPYRAAFLRGLDYIFAAQYPNGGWPQVWPLEGGYHDAITYNDDAVLNIMELLNDVAAGTNEFAFAPWKPRARAAASVQRGIECILVTQIIVDGRRTVWGQQHDPLTLETESGRNYEMPSQCAAESAGLMMFLMRLPNPDARTVAAVHAAAAWFEKTALHNVAYKMAGAGGRQLVPTPGAPLLWARYYEVGSDRPIFGDRDKTIHDDVRELSRERRIGYRWYGGESQRALDQYAVWSKTHP